MRSDVRFEVILAESNIEPPTGPSDVYETANDRSWDCDAQAAFAFGAHNDFAVEYAVAWDDRLDDASGHESVLTILRI
jgi:hypothetical protein